MRTEEYIIILVGVVADQGQIMITYSSNAPENQTAVKVTYSNGKEVKLFDHVKIADHGVLSMPSDGLMPGTYTCTITVGGQEKDSKQFVLN